MEKLCQDVHSDDNDGKVIWRHVLKAFSYARSNLWFGHMQQFALFMAFVRARRTATRRQIKAIELLVESLLKLPDPQMTEKTIKDAVYALGDTWEGPVDRKFITALTVAASNRESDKCGNKPKKLTETGPGIEKESNESAENILTLAIRFAVAYLATPC